MAKRLPDDLVAEIAAETGLYQYQIRLVLIAFIRSVLSQLAQGKTVHFLSLGKFWVRHMKARKGFIPYHQKPTEYPESFVPKFTWGRRADAFVREEAKRNLLGNRSHD